MSKQLRKNENVACDVLVENKQEKGNEIIPIFFAVDDNYAPFLSVALISMMDNASPNYDYRVYILIEKLSKANREKLLAHKKGNFSIEFVSVEKHINKLKAKLHLRAYYTKSTYYRFFIPDLFPQYDKGLYLDCDIAVSGDVLKLYNTELGDNYVAAVTDRVITDIPVFNEYSEKVLCVNNRDYFNAGILVMNLKKFREEKILVNIQKLMEWKTFKVAQDQDYLNVFCHNKVVYLDERWNLTPFPYLDKNIKPYIVHYKINWKPWHYSGVNYEEYFWKYADMSPYKDELYAMREAYSESDKVKDESQYDQLVNFALEDVASVVIGDTLSPTEFLVTLFEDN